MLVVVLLVVKKQSTTDNFKKQGKFEFHGSGVLSYFCFQIISNGHFAEANGI